MLTIHTHTHTHTHTHNHSHAHNTEHTGSKDTTNRNTKSNNKTNSNSNSNSNSMSRLMLFPHNNKIKCYHKLSFHHFPPIQSSHSHSHYYYSKSKSMCYPNSNPLSQGKALNNLNNTHIQLSNQNSASPPPPTAYQVSFKTNNNPNCPSATYPKKTSF